MDKINQTENVNQNPKKRVLFVITQEEFGGAQRFLYELTTRLDEQKYEVLVAGGREQKGDFLKSLEEKNVNTHRLKFLKREINPVFDCLGIMELMRLINGYKPDYLHLNSSKAGVLGSIAGFKIKILRPNKFKNLKIIYRIGGWSFSDPWPLWKKKLFLAAEKITAKFKDAIVVNNKKDYDRALKLKIKPKKELKLIYNGVDALKIEFLPKDEARLKLKIFRPDFIIGTIANFYSTKGLEYLIEAISEIKKLRNLEIKKTKNPNFSISRFLNFSIFIIGDGAEREKLESKIAKYGLKNKIILLGQIQEAYKYMKAFDVFVLPSLKEGFPWVILEAMAAKVPIVATNVGALPEIIENNKNGILVEPKNPQQLAEAIQRLLENERIRQKLSLQAHQTVLFKFPVEKMIRETEELFEDK